MFEYLLIQNYQVHEKLRVDFSPGITTIVGATDVGKSAVLRALRWVCANEPAGDAFIRHGAKGATVRLAVDGHTITRRRSPGGDTNEYHLDEQPFKAFLRGIPEPIVNLLNLGPVCWQGQHDAPYWFADTAGEVSRQLNAIVNLGVIDEVLAKVAGARNRAKVRLDVAEEALTAAKRAHTGLAWVDGFDEALVNVEVLEARALAARQRCTVAGSLVAGAISTQKAKERVAGVVLAGDFAALAGAAALRQRDRANLLAELHERAVENYWAATCHIPPMGALDDTFKHKNNAAAAVRNLRELLSKAEQLEECVCEAEKDWMVAVKAMPKACPTCGRS